MQKESKRLGLPVYVLDARKWMHHDEKKYGFKLFEEDGPFSFLYLMKNAEQVYVESFHGVIFSSIFKKEFFLLDDHKDFSEMDLRLRDILILLNAKERVLTPSNYDYIDFNSIPEVDSISDNKILKDMQEKSMEYIKNSLQ